jgi:phage baseplate assembly protein gpV
MPSLEISYDQAADVLTVEGVRYAGELFRTLAFPNTSRLYRFLRAADDVTVVDCGPVPQSFQA